jgi:hypothetical protein
MNLNKNFKIVTIKVNYPAAELRGIKNQNIIALVADTLYNDV